MTNRPDSAAIAAIVAAVSMETGIAAERICSRERRGDVLRARQLCMRRAQAAGARQSVVSGVLGVTRAAISRGLVIISDIDTRHSDVEFHILLAPFRRPSGRMSPLTLGDYGVRAKMDLDEATSALATIQNAGLVVRMPATRQDCPAIYEITAAGLEALQ